MLQGLRTFGSYGLNVFGHVDFKVLWSSCLRASFGHSVMSVFGTRVSRHASRSYPIRDSGHHAMRPFGYENIKALGYYGIGLSRCQNVKAFDNSGPHVL